MAHGSTPKSRQSRQPQHPSSALKVCQCLKPGPKPHWCLLAPGCQGPSSILWWWRREWGLDAWVLSPLFSVGELQMWVCWGPDPGFFSVVCRGQWCVLGSRTPGSFLCNLREWGAETPGFLFHMHGKLGSEDVRALDAWVFSPLYREGAVWGSGVPNTWALFSLAWN